MEIIYCCAKQWAVIRRDRRKLKNEVWRLATAIDIRNVKEQYQKDWDDYYTQAIAEKYGVGLDWEKNRWFVEQVRPTLLRNY